MKPKVYFTDMSAVPGKTLLDKLRKLMKAAGFEDIKFANQYAAVKLHFGEPGNLSYLRPNFAKLTADYIRELGGKPFLTDCNTLYVGGRKNALDHLDSAYENGFSPMTVGCNILIGDGLKGTDEVEIEVPDAIHIKTAKIGRAVMDADIFISLNHFKGHEATGFGGALKNIGMGCGSRAGKMEMHNAGKPRVAKKACVACKKCLKQCAHSAIEISSAAVIDQNKCVGCGRCIGVCPTDAIHTSWDESTRVLCEKIAEYTAAVLRGRPAFHISFVMDISPDCDCHSENDTPIVANVGIFASADPVALDVACADAVNAMPPAPGSKLERSERKGDHFSTIHPITNWRWTTEHAVKLGLGSEEYDLVEI
ncbi:MAG: DUF362 domain-containing protein [Defluviitaleaceae bacterium]|nr:DUF362 domain-containing protein [Defluviitaleaceae bacterium]